MNLRRRMIIGALIPAALVATVLTSFFLYRHLVDLDRAVLLRAQALARQAAATAEFSLITGNREFLRDIVRNVLESNEDVIAVSVMDAKGEVAAQIGVASMKEWPHPDSVETRAESERGVIIAVPVRQKTLAVDDVYSGADYAVASRPHANLGQVVIELSRARMDRDREQFILLAVLTGLLGAAIGGGMAWRLARSVTLPVLEASDVVTRIGRGDLAARVRTRYTGPVNDLALGINAMAERVSMTQEKLREQVSLATGELIRQRDSAEKATAAKSRFLAAASHDLRQPLHAIGLFVSRLSKLQLTGEPRRLVSHVEESVGSLQDMLDTLLDLSRLEADTYRIDASDFLLQPLLQRICRDLAPLAQERRISLRYRGCAAWANSDQRLVERVVQNLLGNALSHTSDGKVLLASRRIGDRIRIQVWDNGPGIPVELQGDIFNEYVQVGNDERDRSKGLGLGLAICRRVAKLLKTQINVRSVQGRGSVFWFDLPAGHAVTEPLAAHDALDDLLDGSVMVVDDDAQCRAAMAEVIRSWGADVSAYSNATDALHAWAEPGSDWRVLVSDIRLPGELDGIALGQRLRQKHPNASVVLVSADVAPLVRGYARRAGFPLLKKPVAPARLRATLVSLLEKD